MAEPERYFSIPADGTTITLGGGIAVADFRKGTLKDGNTTYQMKDRLKKGEHIYSLHIRESGGQIVYVWPEGGEKKIPIQASDERDLLLPPFTKLYIQRAAAGAIIDIVASTDISGYFFSGYGLKKKLTDIEDSVRTVRLLGYHGDVYYVDQDVGTDSASTSGRYDDPFETPDYAWSRVTANNGDIIVVLLSTTSYDNNVNAGGILADQAGTAMVMPMNRLVDLVNSNAAATAVITASAANITIIGGFISETTATVEGVVITADNVHVYDMELVGTMELGIRITAANSCVLKENTINGVSGDGIRLAGASTLNRLIANRISGTVGDDGIELGIGCDENWLIDNVCHNIFATGISIGGDNNIIRGGSIGNCANTALDGGTGNVWDVSVDVVNAGSFNRAVGDGVGEVTEIDDLTIPSSGRYTVKLDVDALDVAGEGGTITARLYGKTDDTNYRIEDSSTFDVPGADEVMPAVSSVFQSGDIRLRVTFQTSIAVTGNRIVYWKVIKD